MESKHPLLFLDATRCLMLKVGFLLSAWSCETATLCAAVNGWLHCLASVVLQPRMTGWDWVPCSTENDCYFSWSAAFITQFFSLLTTILLQALLSILWHFTETEKPEVNILPTSTIKTQTHCFHSSLRHQVSLYPQLKWLFRWSRGLLLSWQYFSCDPGTLTMLLWQ